MRACAHAWLRAWLRACMVACVHACVRAFVRVLARLPGFARDSCSIHIIAFFLTFIDYCYSADHGIHQALCWGQIMIAAPELPSPIVQAFYGQKLVNLPQIATEANSTDMIS